MRPSASTSRSGSSTVMAMQSTRPRRRLVAMRYRESRIIFVALSTLSRTTITRVRTITRSITADLVSKTPDAKYASGVLSSTERIGRCFIWSRSIDNRDAAAAAAAESRIHDVVENRAETVAQTKAHEIRIRRLQLAQAEQTVLITQITLGQVKLIAQQ